MGKKLIEGLGIGGDYFRGGICQLKMNKYSYTPETVGLNGAVMHSDTGFFTVLQDDEDVNGLEAVDPITGELVPLDPVPGTLVFNIGDVGKVTQLFRVFSFFPSKYCNIIMFELCMQIKGLEQRKVLQRKASGAMLQGRGSDHDSRVRVSSER